MIRWSHKESEQIVYRSHWLLRNTQELSQAEREITQRSTKYFGLLEKGLAPPCYKNDTSFGSGVFEGGTNYINTLAVELRVSTTYTDRHTQTDRYTQR